MVAQVSALESIAGRFARAGADQFEALGITVPTSIRTSVSEMIARGGDFDQIHFGYGKNLLNCL